MLRPAAQSGGEDAREDGDGGAPLVFLAHGFGAFPFLMRPLAAAFRRRGALVHIVRANACRTHDGIDASSFPTAITNMAPLPDLTSVPGERER